MALRKLNDTGIFERTTKSGSRYQVKWRRADGSQASKTFRTRKEARLFKAEHDVLKGRGSHVDPSAGRITFGEYAAKWVRTQTHHRPSTAVRRDGILRNYLIPALGHVALNRIRHSDLKVLVAHWSDVDGLAPRTVLNQYNVLHPILEAAVHDDLLVKNPADGIRLPRPGFVERHPLTPQECRTLLDTVTPFYAPLIRFTLATGLRWSELQALKIGDLSALGRCVTVRTSKTHAGIRVLSLSPDDVESISAHLARSNRSGAHADEPLFTSPQGKALSYSNFNRRVFGPAVRAAGLDGVTFHDLRRTHATALVAAGLDPKVVQERMGHKSIQTTLAYYAKGTEKAHAKAAGVITQYLEEPDPPMWAIG